MDRDRLKEEAARYLARQAEHERFLWFRPAGIEALPGGSGAVAASDRQQKPSTETETAGRKSTLEEKPGESPGPSVDPSCPEPDPSWPHAAPEPEPVIPVAGKIADPFPAYSDLENFRRAICNCRKCPLGKTRTRFVFGVGDPSADLVMIGEAPGADEDAQGIPFVGRAGRLLDKILEAVDLRRGEGVYICNILKCRPPGNRDPLPSEVEQCEPHLVKQLQLIEPKLIVALGRVAAHTLLRTKKPLTVLRNDVLDYQGIPVLVTYHPAALLRNQQWKRPTWEDVQKMKRMLDGDNS